MLVNFQVDCLDSDMNPHRITTQVFFSLPVAYAYTQDHAQFLEVPPTNVGSCAGFDSENSLVVNVSMEGNVSVLLYIM